MIRVTSAKNLLKLINPEFRRSCVTIVNAECLHKESGIREKITSDTCMSKLEQYDKIIDFRYKNKGKGYIDVHGINIISYDEYSIELLIREPLDTYNDVLDTLSYAVIPRRLGFSKQWNSSFVA